MKKSRFTEQQISYALRQSESGVSIQEITRKMGATEATFYRWKKKFAGMDKKAQATLPDRCNVQGIESKHQWLL